jgi:hypothetical protein
MNDDDVFYLFLQKNRTYTFRKVRTVRGCLEGLALMICKVEWSYSNELVCDRLSKKKKKLSFFDEVLTLVSQ